MRYFIIAPNRTDLYWRPDSQGYTNNLAEAGLYDVEKAKSIENGKRGDKAIPFESKREELIELRDSRRKDFYRLNAMLQDN